MSQQSNQTVPTDQTVPDAGTDQHAHSPPHQPPDAAMETLVPAAWLQSFKARGAVVQVESKMWQPDPEAPPQARTISIRAESKAIFVQAEVLESRAVKGMLTPQMLLDMWWAWNCKQANIWPYGSSRSSVSPFAAEFNHMARALKAAHKAAPTEATKQRAHEYATNPDVRELLKQPFLRKALKTHAHPDYDYVELSKRQLNNWAKRRDELPARLAEFNLLAEAAKIEIEQGAPPRSNLTFDVESTISSDPVTNNSSNNASNNSQQVIVDDFFQSVKADMSGSESEMDDHLADGSGTFCTAGEPDPRRLLDEMMNPPAQRKDGCVQFGDAQQKEAAKIMAREIAAANALFTHMGKTVVEQSKGIKADEFYARFASAISRWVNTLCALAAYHALPATTNSELLKFVARATRISDRSRIKRIIAAALVRAYRAMLKKGTICRGQRQQRFHWQFITAEAYVISNGVITFHEDDPDMTAPLSTGVSPIATDSPSPQKRNGLKRRSMADIGMDDIEFMTPPPKRRKRRASPPPPPAPQPSTELQSQLAAMATDLKELKTAFNHANECPVSPDSIFRGKVRKQDLRGVKNHSLEYKHVGRGTSGFLVCSRSLESRTDVDGTAALAKGLLNASRTTADTVKHLQGMKNVSVSLSVRSIALGD